MKKVLHRVGRFYSSIIMKNVGILIFLGFLGVLFNEQGWFPNPQIQMIFQVVYNAILPSMIAFEAGKRIGEQTGGILAVMAISGVIVSRSQTGILAAMILGPAAGLIWKIVSSYMRKYTGSSLKMLLSNLLLGGMGAVMAGLGYYIFTPILGKMVFVLAGVADYMVAHRLVPVLSLVIEPAKIFFLNNIVNHGILVPLAINQAETAGSSMLFLLEANPGPGLGMLAALCIMKSDRRQEYATAMFAHGAGGLHEVYFPFAFSNLWLIVALIAGGMAGDVCFELLGAGLQGVVSPGSIITILLMAGKGRVIPVLLGILVSTGVSLGVSLLVLKCQDKNAVSTKEDAGSYIEDNSKKSCPKKEIHKIGFVCDAGVGSSAMAASLFRRKLQQNGIEAVETEAYAVDKIPDDLDLIVCQTAFRPFLGEEPVAEVWPVENFVSMEEYKGLIEEIVRRNG